LQRYETRRELVINEANAIGTTCLRTNLLDVADRTRLQSLLREYVDARVEFGNARTVEEELAACRGTAAVQERLWDAISDVVAPVRTTPLAAMLLRKRNAPHAWL
jgi:hypothetical protein